MPKYIKNFLFENLTNRQTFVKNAFWLSFSNIGGRLIRAVIIIYAARVLGAADWGVFSYGITLIAFLTIFVDIGIDPILTRENAKAKGDPVKQSKIISTAFFIKSFFLAIGVMIVIFVAPSFATLPGVVPLINMMAAILVFDTFRNFGFSLIRSREKMEVEAGLFLFTNLAIVVSGFVSLYFWPTVMSFTISYAIGTAIGMTATIYILRNDVIKALSHFSRPLVKEILYSAWPFAVSGVLGMLMLNADILIIGMFRSAEEVGFYSAAVRIIQLLYIFAGIAAQSSLPIFSRFISEEKAKIKTSLKTMLRFAFAFSIPASFCGIAAGGAIIDLLFGKGYLDAITSFRILLLTLAINFTAVILSNIVFVYNKHKLLTIYAAIGGLLNVALDFVLIPKFGISGSAFATLFSSIIAEIYLWYITWKIVGFDFDLKIGKIFLASVISSVFLYVSIKIGLHVIPAIIAAGTMYLAILYLLKETLFKEIKSVLAAR